MKWNRRKLRRIKNRTRRLENYCDRILFANKDVNNSFYDYEKKAVEKLRAEIVLAHNNFRASIDR